MQSSDFIYFYLKALAGKKEPPKWKGLYWVLKDIQRSVDLIHVVEKSAFVGEDGFFVAKMEAMVSNNNFRCLFGIRMQTTLNNPLTNVRNRGRT